MIPRKKNKNPNIFKSQGIIADVHLISEIAYGNYIKYIPSLGKGFFVNK